MRRDNAGRSGLDRASERPRPVAGRLSPTPQPGERCSPKPWCRTARVLELRRVSWDRPTRHRPSRGQQTTRARIFWTTPACSSPRRRHTPRSRWLGDLRPRPANQCDAIGTRSVSVVSRDQPPRHRSADHLAPEATVTSVATQRAFDAFAPHAVVSLLIETRHEWVGARGPRRCRGGTMHCSTCIGRPAAQARSCDGDNRSTRDR